jgi:hypothetical protein
MYILLRKLSTYELPTAKTNIVKIFINTCSVPLVLSVSVDCISNKLESKFELILLNTRMIYKEVAEHFQRIFLY